jgi:hypothetical protein
LSDILLLKRLQDQVVCLDLEAALLWSPAPLSLALLECLSLNQGRSATFVEDDHSTERPTRGFLQAWDRADRLSCDVAFVGPPLDGSTGTAQLWQELLEHLAAVKGESGLQRIFATVPDSGPAPDVFRQSGFSAYARRHVLSLQELPRDIGADASTHFQPVRETDAASIQRLRTAIIPRAVQNAEGGIDAERDATVFPLWWRSRETRDYVWKEDSGTKAHVRLVIGPAGHWLRILLGPVAEGQADTVLRDALCLLASYPPRPLYCATRGYEGGLRGTLDSLGFEPLVSELLMVKHTTVRARVPVNALSPALEKAWRRQLPSPPATAARIRHSFSRAATLPLRSKLVIEVLPTTCNRR